MTVDVGAIRAQAMIETDGFVASTGRERAMPDKQPHIVTYYRECPDRIAVKPATLVERLEVIALCDALTAEQERVRVLTGLLGEAHGHLNIGLNLYDEIADALAAVDEGGA